MEVKGQREGGVARVIYIHAKVTHIHAEVTLDTGRSRMDRVERGSLRLHQCGSVTRGAAGGPAPSAMAGSRAGKPTLGLRCLSSQAVPEARAQLRRIPLLKEPFTSPRSCLWGSA